MNTLGRQIQLYRGSLVDLPVLLDGEPACTTDTNGKKQLWIGSPTGNQLIQAEQHIIDDLVSNDSDASLSARQGKILKDLIDAIGAGGSSVNVVDNLLSDSPISALSARQGKVLKGLVDTKADKTTLDNHIIDTEKHLLAGERDKINNAVPKSGAIMTGGLDFKTPNPIILRSAGGKSQIFHKNGDTLFISPSETVDGSDWDWERAVRIDGMGDLYTRNLNIADEIINLKSSVSNGKAQVANAIRLQGVPTEDDAEFATMANNIALISTGKKFARGNMTLGSSQSIASVNGVGFTPYIVIVKSIQNIPSTPGIRPEVANYYLFADITSFLSTPHSPINVGATRGQLNSVWHSFSLEANFSISADSFSFRVLDSIANQNVTWIAFE